MLTAHPVADEWTEEYSVYVASARSVVLSTPVALFIDHAVTEGLRPVLMTAPEATLSPFVSMAMRRAGGLWAVQEPDGMTYDALSGYRIFGFPDLWSKLDTTRERLSTFGSWSPQPHGVLMFDAYVHQRAAAGTVVGQMGAEMMQALGGTVPDVWGVEEPLTDPWSAPQVSELARRSMPVSPTMHARGPDESFVDIAAGRTPRGVLEHAQGGVPVGPYEGRTAELIDRGASALTMLTRRFQPTVAFASIAEFDEGTVQGVSAKRPEAPLAALIGPRAVHDLEIDADALSQAHDVTLLGRRRTPSLLVRFSAPDRGLWAQLLAFGFDLGAEKVAAAAGLDWEDRDAD
mgnify:CR=1 FL=1